MGTLIYKSDFKFILGTLKVNASTDSIVAGPSQPVQIYFAFTELGNTNVLGPKWEHSTLVLENTAENLGLTESPIMPPDCSQNNPWVIILWMDGFNKTISSYSKKSTNLVFDLLPILPKDKFIREYSDRLKRIIDYHRDQQIQFTKMRDKLL